MSISRVRARAGERSRDKHRKKKDKSCERSHSCLSAYCQVTKSRVAIVFISDWLGACLFFIGTLLKKIKPTETRRAPPPVQNASKITNENQSKIARTSSRATRAWLTFLALYSTSSSSSLSSASRGKPAAAKSQTRPPLLFSSFSPSLLFAKISSLSDWRLFALLSHRPRRHRIDLRPVCASKGSRAAPSREVCSRGTLARGGNEGPKKEKSSSSPSFIFSFSPAGGEKFCFSI